MHVGGQVYKSCAMPYHSTMIIFKVQKNNYKLLRFYVDEMSIGKQHQRVTKLIDLITFPSLCIYISLRRSEGVVKF